MKVDLREYQKQGVDNIRFSYMQGRKSVLYVLPTGGGKTVIFSHIAEQAAKKGNRVCILVHRTELVDQSSKSLKKIGVDHGIITAGEDMDLSKTVQIASVFTLVRRLHLVPNDFFGLLVVDEAHHAVAGSWKKTIDHFDTAKILGVTATPERLDGKGLGNYFEDMVVGEDTAWLTANNFLAPSKVFAPPTKVDRKALSKRGGDFAMDEAEDMMRQGSIMGDAVSHYKKHIYPASAIAFCCTVAHCEAVAKSFQDAGINGVSLTGENGVKDKRKECIDKLGTGEIKVLCSCQIISEGTDVPSVGGAILLRPTASLSLYLQQVGRCLRISEGKKFAIINDHVGNSLVHGLPTEHRAWSLEGKKIREKTQAPPLKICDACFAVNPINAKECVDCGHIFKTERREQTTVEGNLEERTFSAGDYVQYYNHKKKWVSKYTVTSKSEIDGEIFYTLRSNTNEVLHRVASIFVRPSMRTAMQECKTLDDYKKVAAVRGYKQGWAYIKWKQKQEHSRFWDNFNG